MSRTIAHTRLFVTLTLDEAAAIARLQPEPTDTEAIRAVAKIRSALERTIADATSPELSAASTEPPLRAKHYHLPEPLRMAKAALPAKAPAKAPATVLERAPAARREHDYVPYRDEADGVYT